MAGRAAVAATLAVSAGMLSSASPAVATQPASASTIALLVAKQALADAQAQRAAACYYPTSAKCTRMIAAEDDAEAQVAAAADEAGPGADTMYVATGGSDAEPGSVDRPLATLTTALKRAQGGEKIVVAAGSYGKATDVKARTQTVTVVGPSSGTASIAGMEIAGGQSVDISGVRFTTGVLIRDHTTIKGQFAEHVTLHDVAFTAASNGTCIAPRNGSKDIEISDSSITGCQVGIGAPAGGAIAQSTGLLIKDNRIEHLAGDGIQIGQWSNLTITGNTIDDVRDPASTYHNDGIQFTGNVFGAVISHNRVTNSRTQLILIQDAVGPIDDVLVENNLLKGAGAVAMQSLGATDARFVHNTVMGGKDGGLWLGRGSTRNGTNVVPTDSVVANNVLSTYRVQDNARTAVAGGNVGPCNSLMVAGSSPVPGWTCLTDVGFVDPAGTDLSLRPDSAARPMGIAAPTAADDLDGADRSGPPVPGAFR